ncbi:MAG: FAD binding domain-containing protein [Chloroflexi bacterium]|nr:FAD binding domain-containing protein [Chloroflexota bacterium]
MTLEPFKYISVDTLQAAEDLLKEHGDRSAVIAGGTDLLGALKDAIHAHPPELLIGLKSVTDLNYVTVEADGVRIGALTTLAQIAKHPAIRQTYPLLSQAATSVASPQIRNVATIAGNLCQEPRCWYYRNPDNTFDCLRKGGGQCDALFAENRYHSIFGGMSVAAAPCTTGCPIHNDIPAYMETLRLGQVEQAAATLLRTNPLAAITGRACAHYCEEACNRVDYDQPVSIRDVERYLGDYALEHARDYYRSPEAESGKSVAVVGAGPAGLTAAYFLRKQGHAVTVYDRMPEAGGMLAHSIPAYRLPKAVVRAQIEALGGMGIRFETGINVGNNGVTLDDLRSRHASIFLATGLWNGKKLRLERGDLLDSGLEFLMDVQAGAAKPVGERVLVIGGGSVAVDVAITAKRMGARQVTMACLESLEIMPAIPEDIEQAHEEGIAILPSWGPQRVVEQDGKLTGIELVRCTSVFDKDGRFAPSFDPEVTTIAAADQVLLAIGQAADLAYLGTSLGTERGMIVADNKTAATSLDGVFAGGDVTGGPATVVQAMAAGKKAAIAIDAYLRAAPPQTASAPRSQDRLTINQAALATSSRTPTPRLHAPQRTLLGEDASTLTADAVTQEAFRCANCGCVAVNASDLATALIALDAQVKTNQRTLAVEELFAAAVSRTTVLAADELIEEIRIPALPPESRQIYLKFRTRNAIDFPIVGLAFRATLRENTFHDARLVLGAVAPIPLRARAVEDLLEGQAPSETLAQEAALLAVRDAQPLARNKAKVEVVKALVKKAIASQPG